MESCDQIKGSKSFYDVMNRRLKNRERQRRYRERKRLQAYASKPCVSNQSSSQFQIVKQVVTRVHCVRNWKKDARRVCSTSDKQEPLHITLSSNSQSSAGQNLPWGVQEVDVEQSLKSEAPSTNYSRLDDCEKVRSKPGRRDWKAEARNKDVMLSVTQSLLLHSG